MINSGYRLLMKVKMIYISSVNSNWNFTMFTQNDCILTIEWINTYGGEIIEKNIMDCIHQRVRSYFSSM